MKEDNGIRDELLRHALCSTNDGVVIADARAEGQPLIFVNPAFTTITGYSYTDAVGTNCRFLQGEEHDQPELDLLRKALQEGTECRVILRNFRKNGTPFWNELHIAPIEEDGETAYFIGVQSDVTARIEAEKEAEALRRKLEELNEQKNQFIGMAAHDLRNPLNTISCTAQLLELWAKRDEQKENIPLLARIRETADFMSDLILDMLDVSKIESGHMELLRESIDMAELLEQALEMQQHRAQLKNISLIPPIAPPISLNIDRRKILQVIDNLTSNAIKYAPEGSEVVLKLDVDHTYVSLRVIDQGCGIDPDDQQKIFDPFGRAKKNRPTGGESSTGLGLFISRSIIEAHQGRLLVESSTGQGSTFIMQLPLEPNA